VSSVSPRELRVACGDTESFEPNLGIKENYRAKLAWIPETEEVRVLLM
jgi:hypothetical protein